MKTWKEHWNLRNGHVEGDIVYICDIQVAYNGIKLFRKEPPKEAVICRKDRFDPNSKFIKKANNEFFFFELKNGQTVEKVINIYDSQGNSMKIFDTYEEAVDYYNLQLEKVEDIYNSRIKEYETAKEKIQSLKIQKS